MIFYCGTKDDVIRLYKKAEFPLDDNVVTDLGAVELQLQEAGLSEAFVIVDSQCRICNYRLVLIVPEICNLDNLECANCKNMTVQEREIPEWEKANNE